MKLGIVYLLTAEAVHGSQVVRELLVLESRDCHFSQVYDQIAADNFVVFDVALEFRDLIEHRLDLIGLFSCIFEQTFECELALINFVDCFFLVLNLLDGIGACSLYTLFARDSFDQGLKLHKLALDPISHGFKWILNVFSLKSNLLKIIKRRTVFVSFVLSSSPQAPYRRVVETFGSCF